MNKKGVFGLTSVQAFFAVILGIALLAYVIVIIMGTLSSAPILTSSDTARVAGETGSITVSGYTLLKANTAGFSSPSLAAINTTSGKLIASGNWTVSSTGVVTNASAHEWDAVTFNYTYSYSSAQGNAQSITGNVSSGISGFFGSINPVYAILAVLVIILVLVVLVRVVTGGQVSRSSDSPGVM